jgi:hypothetical protein
LKLSNFLSLNFFKFSKILALLHLIKELLDRQNILIGIIQFKSKKFYFLNLEFHIVWLTISDFNFHSSLYSFFLLQHILGRYMSEVDRQIDSHHMYKHFCNFTFLLLIYFVPWRNPYFSNAMSRGVNKMYFMIYLLKT